MRAGTYPARHLATLRGSELPPAFSGASPGWTPVSRTASGQDSAPVHTLSGLRGPMFLLNSQAPLGTATCGPRVNPRTAGTPSPEVTGPICRVPWPGLPPDALGFSPRGTCVGSRYGRGGSFPDPFSRAPGLGRRALTGPHSRLRPVLAMTALPGLQRLAGATTPVGLSRGVGVRACVAAPTPAAREY